MPDIITWLLLLCTVVCVQVVAFSVVCVQVVAFSVVCVQVVAFSVEYENEFEASDGKRLFSSAECSLLLHHCIETTPFTCVSASLTFPH